jgi:hypothetical protein
MKYLKGFFLFWYDFLVGDSMALAIGGVLVLLLGAGLVAIDAVAVAQIVLPIAAASTLAASLPQLWTR